MNERQSSGAVAAGIALILAPVIALVIKAAVFPGWMLFIIVMASIPLILGYALQIVVAANGMLRTRGVFRTMPGRQRGIIAAWITSVGILLVGVFLVDGGDDGTYGSAFTELLGTSSTPGGEQLSATLMLASSLLWIGGWLWLVIEWIVLLAQRRSAVRAAGAWPGRAAQAHPGGRDA